LKSRLVTKAGRLTASVWERGAWRAGMWRIPPRILGALLTGYAFIVSYFLSVFRMVTAGELPQLIRADVTVGSVFAVGVALLGIPPVGKNTWRWWGLLTPGVVLAWGLVAGGLAACHYHQYLVRSTLN
jgi:hypothetical protein